MNSFTMIPVQAKDSLTRFLIVHQARRAVISDFAALVILHHRLNAAAPARRHRVAEADALLAGFGHEAGSQRKRQEPAGAIAGFPLVYGLILVLIDARQTRPANALGNISQGRYL
jgi:hypothetical protein